MAAPASSATGGPPSHLPRRQPSRLGVGVQPHAYPPRTTSPDRASSSASTSSSSPSPWSSSSSSPPLPLPRICSYLVSTETDSVSDLRLQVIQDPACASLRRKHGPAVALNTHAQQHPHSSLRHGSQAAAAAVPRPLWFRERVLTASDDEIMDRIVDASTGRASWTIHRPTRGWYLHIRSPLLPHGFTIPLRPARPEFVTSSTGIQDPTSTPLTFSLGTRVDLRALGRCKRWIEDIRDDEEHKERARHSSGRHGHAALHRKDGGGGGGGGGDDARDDFIAVQLNGVSNTAAATASTEGGDFTRGHTARTSSVSATAAAAAAAAAAASQRHTRRRSAGVSADSPDVRMNLSGTFDRVAEDEGDGGDDGGGGGDDTSTRQQEQPPPRSTRPSQCYFLLIDGAAGCRPSSHNAVPALAPGRVPEGSHRLGWAKWVWSLVPAPVRPPLAFDTSKSFSVRWFDVPRASAGEDQAASEGGRQDVDVDVGGERQQQQEEGSGDAAATGSFLEVMRYEDEGGWLLWQSKTRGRFVLQEEAIRAIGIDRGFWIAVGLAYLEFLEERDGYNAASEG